MEKGALSSDDEDRDSNFKTDLAHKLIQALENQIIFVQKFLLSKNVLDGVNESKCPILILFSDFCPIKAWKISISNFTK